MRGPDAGLDVHTIGLRASGTDEGVRAVGMRGRCADGGARDGVGGRV
ncbi:hypothetical protein AB0K18_49380 [Nonomuraea sp. NPDC049421]